MRRALLLLASVTAFGMPAVAVHAQATRVAVTSASDPTTRTTSPSALTTGRAFSMYQK